MKLERRATAHNLYNALADVIMVTLSFLVCFFLRFDLELVPITKGDDDLSNYLRLIPLLWVTTLLSFATMGIYKSSLERRRIWEENFLVARAHVFAFLVFVASAYFLFDHRYSRVFLGFHFLLAPVLLPFGRSAVRKLIRFKGRMRPSQGLGALIIGEGPVCERLLSLIDSRPDWHLRVRARLEPGDLATLKARLMENDVDIVFVTTHERSSLWVEEVMGLVGDTLAEIIYVPDFGAPTFLSPRFIELGGIHGVVLNANALDGFGPFFKRAFDILFSLGFILVMSPVFIICALAVKLSSPGPVLYRQERMGLDGKTFECLKFRGMHQDAEERTGPVWAKKDDDRTTAVGRWLRKSSLDEIPQFFNVLKGDMSVVGPRPERPVFVDQFRSHIPGYMLRHTMKAGITGWAQINGWRGDTSLEKRIECDLWYLQNWSLALDVRICLLTPFKGLIHPNAY